MPSQISLKVPGNPAEACEGLDIVEEVGYQWLVQQYNYSNKAGSTRNSITRIRLTSSRRELLLMLKFSLIHNKLRLVCPILRITCT